MQLRDIFINEGKVIMYVGNRRNSELDQMPLLKHNNDEKKAIKRIIEGNLNIYIRHICTMSLSFPDIFSFIDFFVEVNCLIKR